MSPLRELPDPPEAGRAHLLRALAVLPVRTPDAAVWRRLAGQLASEQALARALPALPVRHPDPGLWARISGRLDQSDAPPPEPDEAVWAAITARLDTPAAPRPWWLRTAGHTRRRAGLAAAALLLLLASGLALWRPRPAAPLASQPLETVSYSEEVVAAAPPSGPVAPALPPDALDRQGQAFIDAHCSSLPAVCRSAQFRELRQELDALDTEEAQLADDLRRFGNQPELLRHQGHVTTQKATTTRALIRLLIS